VAEFRKIARFGKNSAEAVDVQRAQLEVSDTVYMTVPVEGEAVNGELNGAIGVKSITRETHVISDPLVGSHLAARAILLNVAYQGNTEVSTLATTVPREDAGKMKDYETLGFTIDMGDTRDMDRRGRKMATEAILLSHQNGKRATTTLIRQHIHKHQVVDDGIRSSVKWRDEY
jgi:hypothetical protein